MARGDPELLSFNAGELTPLLRGRTDFDKYRAGAQVATNVIPTPQGALRRRVGSQYVDNANTATGPVVLIPFEASTGIGFVMEIGNGYTRFWLASTRTPIYNFGGVWGPSGISRPTGVAELNTPWTTGLIASDGTVALKVAQSNDVMWLVHPQYPPIKISRTAAYTFTWNYMGDFVNANAPFKDVSTVLFWNITAAAKTGATQLTSAVPYFSAEMVGEYIYLEQPAADSVKPWEAGKAVLTNDVRRSDGRNYVCTLGATTGTVKPTHSFGTKSDGLVNWQWNDDGYGIAQITGFTSATVAPVTVLKTLPDSVVASGTLRWARQAWNATDGWPVAVAFFRERLCFARGQTVWCSVAGDFENFTTTDGGQVTADLATVFTLASERNDRIQWMAAGNGPLLIGTSGGEFAVSEMSTADAFGPGNVRAGWQSGYGSVGAQPLKISESILYAQRGGKRVREMVYDVQLDGYRSDDRQLLAEHLPGRNDGKFVGMAHQRQPDSVVWCRTSTGALFTMTYERQQNIYAWCRQSLGAGNQFGAAVQSMCSITGPDGVADDVWLCVLRTVGGVPTFTLEVIGVAPDIDALVGQYYYHDIPTTRHANYLDCSAPGTVAAGQTVPDTLGNDAVIGNGDTVSALLDGCVAPDSIAFGHAKWNAPAIAAVPRRVRVGFNYVSDWQPMGLIGSSGTGTPQGKVARVWGCVVRVLNTVGFLFGTKVANLQRVEMRSQHDQLDTAVSLKTGDYYVTPESDFDDVPTIYLRQDQPLPMTILGLYPKLNVEDSR